MTPTTMAKIVAEPSMETMMMIVWLEMPWGCNCSTDASADALAKSALWIREVKLDVAIFS